MFGLLGLALLGTSAAWGRDCGGRWLTLTERAICADRRLLRMEDQVARGIRRNAERLTFGQYLGLRHWHALQASERNSCGADRECIVAGLRSQARFLDRLQRCLTSSFVRRACLHNLLADERDSVRR